MNTQTGETIRDLGASESALNRSAQELSDAFEAVEADESARQTQLTTIGLVNNLLANPNQLDAVSGTVRRARVGVGSTPARLLQLKALTSLNEREKLRGSGAISDFEANLLANSANTLNSAILDNGTVRLPEGELEQQLRNLRGISQLRIGETADVLVTDPASGETRSIQELSRDQLDSLHLDGFVIDFQ